MWPFTKKKANLEVQEPDINDVLSGEGRYALKDKIVTDEFIRVNNDIDGFAQPAVTNVSEDESDFFGDIEEESEDESDFFEEVYDGLCEEGTCESCDAERNLKNK